MGPFCGEKSDTPVQLDQGNALAGWWFPRDTLKAALRGDLLLNPSIDLSNACNLNCPYCFIEEKNSTRKERRPDELSLGEIVQVLCEFAQAGACSVNIVGAGEPTVDPHFVDVLEALTELDLVPVVFTNGIQLASDSRVVDILHQAGATVVLKYNSSDEDIQDLVAGRVGYSRIRNKALVRLLEKGFASTIPTRLGLDTLAFQGNYAALPNILQFCRRENIHPLIADFIPTGRTQDGRFSGEASTFGLAQGKRVRIRELLQPLDSHQRRSLLQDLRDIDKGFEIVRSPVSAYYTGGQCTQSLGLYVDIRGNIWPCVARARVTRRGLTDGLLGNTREGTKLLEVWRDHPYMKYIRSTFTGGCPYKQDLSGEVLISLDL